MVRHPVPVSYDIMRRLTYITAGQTTDQVIGSNTSVFNGSFSHDWEQLNFKDAEQSPNHTAIGINASMLANRLSWFFNLQGASCNIDSACSSSLLGLDLACRSLASGECDMVLFVLHHSSYR
jgi:acyl transferase domain-containing protein